MRILLDECVNAGVKAAFPGHRVQTVAEIGWSGSGDGPLLAHAQELFDVFVTIDRKLQHQHNLSEFRIGFVIVRVPDNQIVSYLPVFGEILRAAEAVKPGQVIHVPGRGIR